MTIPILIPTQKPRHGSTSTTSGVSSNRKQRIIRSISPSYIHINSIKNSCTSSHSYSSSCNHPLDLLEDDSDSESVFDDSFENSSISSSNSSINSSFLRSSSPLNINLKSKCQVSLSSANTSSTTTNNNGTISPGSPTGAAFQKLSYFERSKPIKPSLLSRPSSLSLFRTKNLTKKPTKQSTKTTKVADPIKIGGINEYNDPKILDDTLPSIELQTFKLENPITYMDTIKVPNKVFKHRDERINSNFLKLYSIDYSSRMSSVLPNSNSEMIPINQLKFHQDHNLYKLSLSSRDKLWENIILPPRSDDCPKASIDHNDYIFVGSGSNNSLTMKNGDILPWTTTSERSLKPTGVLKGKRSLVNGPNPNSGVTSCQYTIKGWSNSRWIDSSNE